MENLEIIELIMQKVTVKYIQRDCKKLLKHFSKKSSKDIGIVAELTRCYMLLECMRKPSKCVI